jgi:hypothetical protein
METLVKTSSSQLFKVNKCKIPNGIPNKIPNESHNKSPNESKVSNGKTNKSAFYRLLTQ